MIKSKHEEARRFFITKCYENVKHQINDFII